MTLLPGAGHQATGAIIVAAVVCEWNFPQVPQSFPSMAIWVLFSFSRMNFQLLSFLNQSPDVVI